MLFNVYVRCTRAKKNTLCLFTGVRFCECEHMAGVFSLIFPSLSVVRTILLFIPPRKGKLIVFVFQEKPRKTNPIEFLFLSSLVPRSEKGAKSARLPHHSFAVSDFHFCRPKKRRIEDTRLNKIRETVEKSIFGPPAVMRTSGAFCGSHSSCS